MKCTLVYAPPVSRELEHRYEDPLGLIWQACAGACGLTVVRSDEVYASFDGGDILSICTGQAFDPDDSLAQLIYHELCHGLVAGSVGQTRVDWGLDGDSPQGLVQEHACHRLQAALADRYGLRAFFAVTTDHRTYWDELPLDPLAPGDDPAIELARRGFHRALHGPWAAPLADALSRTAALATLLRGVALPAESLWRTTRPVHAAGFPVALPRVQRCGDCAWSTAPNSSAERAAIEGQGGVVAGQCLHAVHMGPVVTPEMSACVRFEPRLDESACSACGACCRQGFDRVEVELDEPFARLHPDLVARDGFGAHVPRPGGDCVALQGDGAAAGPVYRCRVYQERPTSCADFEVGGEACLLARQRVGLSPGGGPRL